MNLIAKPIVKNQRWIVTDGCRKVGNIETTGGGYNLSIGGKNQHFDSTRTMQRFASIRFERPISALKNSIPYAVWPTSGKTYNNMFDIKRKLHVYTKTKKSRCYHVAGWFKMKLGDSWTTIFCPKYIFIQRYEWLGPYKTMDDAENT